MGCVFSRAPDPRIFHVWNVDDQGNEINRGKIEVTDTDLILYQRGRQHIKWPLRGLRRYGFDAELFSFESGRRCPTGPGIYAFKCHRAEALFNMLQECIQNSGGGGGGGAGMGINSEHQSNGPLSVNGSVANGSISSQVGLTVDASGYLEPIALNPQTPVVSSSSRTNIGSTAVSIHSETTSEITVPSTARTCHGPAICGQTPSPHYMNDDIIRSGGNPSESSHQYVNSCARCGLPHPEMVTPQSCVDVNTNYAKLDDLLKQEHSVKHHKEHFYMNVNTGAEANSAPAVEPAVHFSRVARSVSAHFYANHANQNSPASLASPEHVTTQPPVPDEERQVNYIILDLDHQSDSSASVVSPVTTSTVPAGGNSSNPASPTRTPEGYATIDFDKTAALSNSANPSLTYDDSVRKTRHNSTIPAFGSLPA